MRIHVQNPKDDPLYRISPEMWQSAVTRAGDIGRGHEVSFADDQAAFVSAMAEAEALVGDKDAIRALMPCAAPKLRILFVTSAGLDNLAPFDWLPASTMLLNNRGTHQTKAGEFGIMALLMLAGRIPEMLTNQRAGRWEKLWGTALAGRRVTIVGLGTLGGSVAAQAARFGAHVTGVRTRAQVHPACAEVIAVAELDRVLPETEYLVLACPLTAATRGLVDRRRLGLLPPRAGIVNMGRGPLVDQDAICEALESGTLSGAVLDVFQQEPVPPGHRLWTTPNLVMTPHTGTDDPTTYNPLSLDIFFENLRALRDGREPPNRFDIARGY
jgi:phosphoglycerate dehydrogenase-like enzyme